MFWPKMIDQNKKAVSSGYLKPPIQANHWFPAKNSKAYQQKCNLQIK